MVESSVWLWSGLGLVSDMPGTTGGGTALVDVELVGVDGIGGGGTLTDE